MVGEERFVCDEHVESYLTTFAEYWTDPLAEARKRKADAIYRSSRASWILIGALLGAFVLLLTAGALKLLGLL